MRAITSSIIIISMIIMIFLIEIEIEIEIIVKYAANIPLAKHTDRWTGRVKRSISIGNCDHWNEGERKR